MADRLLVTLKKSTVGTNPSARGTVRALGLELFRTYFYAFEAISLLLVVAMIGAVLLGKRRI